LSRQSQIDLQSRISDPLRNTEETPLHIAARLGNADIVTLLLKDGANVDAVTKDGATPLHIATKDGHDEVASILIENGASLHSANKKGFSPLHMAAKYGNIKVAHLLIDRKAPVDAQGKNNVTPLHCAAHYDHPNIALLLLEKGANPHAIAKNGYTVSAFRFPSFSLFLLFSFLIIVPVFSQTNSHFTSPPERIKWTLRRHCLSITLILTLNQKEASRLFTWQLKKVTPTWLPY